MVLALTETQASHECPCKKRPYSLWHITPAPPAAAHNPHNSRFLLSCQQYQGHRLALSPAMGILLYVLADHISSYCPQPSTYNVARSDWPSPLATGSRMFTCMLFILIFGLFAPLCCGDQVVSANRSVPTPRLKPRRPRPPRRQQQQWCLLSVK